MAESAVSFGKFYYRGNPLVQSAFNPFLIQNHLYLVGAVFVQMFVKEIVEIVVNVLMARTIVGKNGHQLAIGTNPYFIRIVITPRRYGDGFCTAIFPYLYRAIITIITLGIVGVIPIPQIICIGEDPKRKVDVDKQF